MTTSYPQIQASHIEVGVGVFIHPTAVIKGVKGVAQSVRLGDHVYIGEQVQILCDDFSLGDYGKIHHHTNVHGASPCKIGHNAWIGQYSLLDSTGGISIGDNCGIGAHSQLWSHIKYGDTLAGCRFNSVKPLVVGKDVWFVGHSIVSPVTVNDKAMVLVGSVVTRDLAYNSIYAGSPAVDITPKVGPPFMEIPIHEKMNNMQKYLEDFRSVSLLDISSLRIVEEAPSKFDKDITYFIVATRQYTKNRTEVEIAFIKYLLPEKAKFTPLIS